MLIFRYFQTSPMQFFYCVYQRTQVLTRKRIKKRTKTGSKRSPPAKRMRMDTKAPATANNNISSPWKSPGRETAESAEMSRLTSTRPEPAASRQQQEANTRTTPPNNQPSTKLKISLSRGSVEDGSVGKGGKKSPVVTASISRSSSSSTLAAPPAAKAGDAKSKYTTSSANTKTVSQPSKQPMAKATLSVAQTAPTLSPASSMSSLSNRKVSSATTSSKTPSPKPAPVANPTAKPVQTSVPNSSTNKPSASQLSQAAKPTSVSKASAAKSVAPPVKSSPAAAAPKLTSILKNGGSNSPVPQGILKNGNSTPTASVKTAPAAAANPKPVVGKVTTNNSVTTTANTTVTTPAKPISTPTTKSVTISNNVTVSTANNSVSKPVTPTVSKPVTTVNNTPTAPNNAMKVQDSNKTPTTRPTPPLKPILKHPTPEQKRQLEQPLPKISMLTPASKGEKPSSPSPAMPKSILKASTESKTTSLKPASKKKEVVEISVEVSASDVKKVLEKKKAEKDHMRLGLANSTPVTSTGVEEKLYSNYSIVDQIKKAGSSALARHQTEQRAASMMDFTRGGDALSSVPKVPPTIQGLQPTLKPIVPPAVTCHTSTSVTESTALSSIVQSLANKQQKQLQENGTAGKDSLQTSGTPSNNNNNGSKVEGKSLATMLSCKSDTALSNQLPVNTSIRAINKDGSSVNSFEATNKQNFNFYKSNMAAANSKPMVGSGSLSDAVKNAESLAKNIPAGTTVTVKTVDNNKMSGKTSPAVSNESSSPKPRSPKTTINNKVSMSVSSNSTMARPTMSMVNPFSNASNLVASSPQSQSMLMSQFHNSLGAMALHHNLLNFSNPVAALAAAQMDAAMRAVAAQQAVVSSLPSSVVSSLANPVTTLNFTNPTLSSSVSVADDISARFGLKIPTPPSRTSSPAVSGFGTSRLQVKVNSDSPRNSGSPNNGSTEKSDNANSVSNVKAIHSMPAILPFPTVKKAQAIPKSLSQQNRPSPTSQPSSPLTSQPMSTLPSSMSMFRSVTPAQMAQVNSLKKLAADLNTVHQKTLKGDNNILNPLKKPSSDGKKLGLEAGINNKEGVTSS